MIITDAYGKWAAARKAAKARLDQTNQQVSETPDTAPLTPEQQADHQARMDRFNNFGITR